MWPWIAAGMAALLIAIIAVNAIYRYLDKIARHSIFEQFEMREKTHTWEDLGISEELQQEFQEWEEQEIKLLNEQELEGMIQGTLARVMEYESRLRDICKLAPNTVLKSHLFEHGVYTKLENDTQAIEIIHADDVRTKKIFPDSYDSEREDALFVIEENVSEKIFHGILPFRRNPRILLRRLTDYGTYDPEGELLMLEKILERIKPMRVELVGKMNRERTEIIYAFPQK